MGFSRFFGGFARVFSTGKGEDSKRLQGRPADDAKEDVEAEDFVGG